MRKFGKHFWDNKTFVISAQINLRIRMSADNITFMQTVLYDGKIKIKINKKYFY